jgi:transcriptional regulator with XRE-family HTH domain
MAADTGVDRAYMSELEREQGNATVDLLDRLASVLDAQVREFFEPPEGSGRTRFRGGAGRA